MLPTKWVQYLKDNLVPSGGVRERTIKSSIWVVVMKVGGRTLQTVKLVVLANLLSPADFGLLGIAMLALAVLEQFSKLGIDTALIQRSEQNIDRYLNTAWTMQIARGVTIASVLYLLAPVVADFFGEPRTTDIIRVLALLPLIIGFRNPGIVYLEKNLEFHRRFLLALSGPVANVSLSITLAVMWESVWALVYGSIAGTVVTFLVSYYVHDFRPRPRFDRSKARELYGYGKWITGSAIVTFLIGQGDDAFVGWLLTATALGYYQMGYRLSNIAATEVASTISGVVFPAYSQLQEDKEKLRKACYMTVQFVAVLTFPMVAGIAVVAPVFVRAVLGEKWLPMVTTMQIIAFWGGLRALNRTIVPMFNALGRPDFSTKVQAGQLVLIAVTIYPATEAWGIAGTALSVVFSAFVTTPLLVGLAVKQIDGDGREFARILFYPAIATILMCGGVWFSRDVLETAPLLELGVLVALGAGLYTVAMLGFERRFDYGIERLYRQVVTAIR